MHRADADELVGIIEAAVSAVYQQVQATTGFPLRQWLQIGERTPQGTTFGYGFRAHPFGPIEIDATGLFGLAAVERLIEVLNTRPTVRENLFAPALNPAMVWMRLLAPVLSACIRRSRSFAQEYDPPLVRTILAEALGSILSDTPVGTLLAPLLNVDVTLDELQFAPNITIRRARLDEIEDFINPPEGPVHLPVSPLVLLTSGAILEINIPHAIGDTMWAVDSMRMADEILTAVRQQLAEVHSMLSAGGTTMDRFGTSSFAPNPR